MLSNRDEPLCEECCLPCSFCTCGAKSEFICDVVDIGIDRLVNQYNTFYETYTNWWQIAKWRTLMALVFTIAPVDYKRNLKIACGSGIVVGGALRLSLIPLVLFMLIWIIAIMALFIYLAWKQVYNRVASRVGILSHLADDSMKAMMEYRKTIFIGSAMVSFAYLLYRSFRPKSQLVTYREQLPEYVKDAFVRANKAKTTTIDNILPHMKKDLGVITIRDGDKVSQCLAFPIESNFYVTVGHIIPEKDFVIEIFHENGLTPTVAKQKLSSNHVYRFPKKDLVLIQIPSAVPRRGYKDFLLGRDTTLGNQVVNIVTMDLSDMRRSVSATRMEPGWSMMSATVRTDKVVLHKPYRYNCNLGTKDGMCGSLIVDFDKAIIYGFHVAGNGVTGLCNTLTIDEIDEAMKLFKGFIPLNQGDLQVGSNSLKKELGMIEMEIKDPDHDKPIEDHNCITEGVLGDSATFRHPYVRHPFKEAIVSEFGEPKFGPPQKINSHFHKRKALTKLTNPNQEFSLDELEFAAEDYIKPIREMIHKMPKDKRVELGRILTLQETLDGTGEQGLGGIDNSTSSGFLFKGKKKSFLERDPLDPDIPLAPRQLVENNGVSIVEEMQEMKGRYLAGMTCRALFKCSVKVNELLSVTKLKARVFMGCNFPFLLLCRQHLAPVIRLMSKNKFLFESANCIRKDEGSEVQSTNLRRGVWASG
jgi:hypothetical protein